MNPVDRDAFEALLDTHGATPDRWPDALREGALDLVREDPEAHAQWKTALELDALLDDWTVPAAAPDLAVRIAAAAPDGGLADVVALRGLRLWQGALLATVPVLVGFLIAVTQVDPTAADRAGAEAELAHISSFGLLPPRETPRP